MSFLWQATFIKKNLPVLISVQYPHKSMVPALYAYGMHVPEPKKRGYPYVLHARDKPYKIHKG